MEYALAIGYVETAILQLRKEEKKISKELIEKRINNLLTKDKEIIVAYVKMALSKVKENNLTIKEIEKQIQYLSDEYKNNIQSLIKEAKDLD